MTTQYMRKDRADPTNGSHRAILINNAKLPYRMTVLTLVMISTDEVLFVSINRVFC
jgi:hypothetical protein